MVLLLYLLATNAEPRWWQITLQYSGDAQRESGEDFRRHVRIEPCSYSRPVVSLRFLGLDESRAFTD
jgi:hypothetical protein